ncbi:MAG: anti-sigma factor antagonist [Solirubrobacteraceae bacterium]|nr:anti-sigma factor antagonist [Solirubrobacteraceae bacterium]
MTAPDHNGSPPRRPTVHVRDEGVDPRTHILILSGDLDASSVSRFKERFEDALGQGKTAMVVDMSELDFIDSVGLMVLMTSLRHLEEREGRLALVSANPRVRRPFEIAGLEAMFDFFEDREAALEHVRSPVS